MARRPDATEMTVRAARADDAPAIAAIYNQGIAGRAATFDTDEVTAHEAGGWLDDGGQPVLVAESDGHVVGWARVIRSDERCSFAGVGEYTIYPDGEWKDLLIVERLLGEAAREA